jgi:hypothetical protein
MSQTSWDRSASLICNRRARDGRVPAVCFGKRAVLDYAQGKRGGYRAVHTRRYGHHVRVDLKLFPPKTPEGWHGRRFQYGRTRRSSTSSTLRDCQKKATTESDHSH